MPVHRQLPIETSTQPGDFQYPEERSKQPEERKPKQRPVEGIVSILPNPFVNRGQLFLGQCQVQPCRRTGMLLVPQLFA
ncbi:MAG: hypothetical protein WBK85_04210 [Petrimonas mucosa]